MDAIIAAVIGFVATIVGCLLTAIVPNTAWFHRLSSKTRHHSLLGTWRSAWGPLPNGPTKYEEILTVTTQRGQRIEGHSHAPIRHFLKTEIRAAMAEQLREPEPPSGSN